MVYPANPTRPIIFKVRRDTLALVAGATAVTFALSGAVHTRREASFAAAQGQRIPASEQDWAGDLAELTPISTAAPTVPFTSASLVVPQAELALPRMPVRPLVKLRGCEGSACMARTSMPSPPRRPVGPSQGMTESVSIAQAEFAPARPLLKPDAPYAKRTFMSRVNPLNHLPDVSTIKRPFAYAGEAVSGWFKRF